MSPGIRERIHDAVVGGGGAGLAAAVFVHNEGGLKVDREHRVLDQNDQAIPGLYATGSTGQGGLLRKHVSILIVEHNLDLVLALADRVFALEHGAVFHQGPAEPLLTDLEYRKQILWL